MLKDKFEQGVPVSMAHSPDPCIKAFPRFMTVHRPMLAFPLTLHSIISAKTVWMAPPGSMREETANRDGQKTTEESF